MKKRRKRRQVSLNTTGRLASSSIFTKKLSNLSSQAFPPGKSTCSPPAQTVALLVSYIFQFKLMIAVLVINQAPVSLDTAKQFTRVCSLPDERTALSFYPCKSEDQTLNCGDPCFASFPGTAPPVPRLEAVGERVTWRRLPRAFPWAESMRNHEVLCLQLNSYL